MSAPDQTAAPAGALAALLRCPQCLQARPAGSRRGRLGAAAAAARVFPTLDGVPWLFAEPESRLVEWRQRFKLLERELDAARQPLQALLASPGTLDAARPRLERLERGYAAQLGELRSLLAPLRLEASIARLETLLALRTRTPLAQDLNSYYVNVHRDWVWGDAENAAALQLVQRPGRRRAAGAAGGAGRGSRAAGVGRARGAGAGADARSRPQPAVVAGGATRRRGGRGAAARVPGRAAQRRRRGAGAHPSRAACRAPRPVLRPGRRAARAAARRRVRQPAQPLVRRHRAARFRRGLSPVRGLAGAPVAGG